MTEINGKSSYKILLDGEAVAQVGDTNSPSNKQGYTGHVGDDTGLVYMQARYYDPVIGRFYSNDPVGFTGEIDTFNRYSYVANNPYKYTDPTGEEKISLGLTGEAMLFAGARVGFSVSFDTETLEVGAAYTAGPRLGIGVGVKPSLTVEQSGEIAQDSSKSEIAVTADVTVGAISYGGEVMSENTLNGDVKNQASFDEPNGKVGLAASVGVEFKGEVTSDAVKQAVDKIKKTFE
ncbi:RHS repeat-associated core domain-containing protein [Idiomarina sp. HP20-50]|uniref:RHS repeat-associated core domain-containing protein n=1 Tax=Idiomarina sp. HP20-50 TaxID=3070813 RepID=UPI00294ABCE9|nr:RHS repeat-associated core domain-containing protein [Idiomarina sp. HP20-50]MDV6314914.1 RHS repeat-associated core domain-containing protein [Idiomarina sp. HP20-50]